MPAAIENFSLSIMEYATSIDISYGLMVISSSLETLLDVNTSPSEKYLSEADTAE